MAISLDSIVHVIKSAAQAKATSEGTVRVAVYVDSSATPFLIDTVREALVPQTTSASVRVERLEEEPAPVKEGTDAVLVLTSGSDFLQAAVGRLVAGGAPVAVLAESSVEVPFIHEDTRMLALICATDEAHLLGSLSRWILDHTEKDTAFAANFPFLRIAASSRAIATCVGTNVATALLPWPAGADLPAMTVSQLDMLFQLAGIYGKPMDGHRAYEAAAVVACAFGLRSVARAATKDMGRGGVVVKTAIAGAGTFAMGLGLSSFYQRDIDYGPLDAVVGRVAGAARGAAGAISSAVSRVQGRAGAGETA